MKPKTIYALLALVALLLALKLVLKPGGGGTIHDLSDAGLVPLLDAGFDGSAVREIRLARGKAALEGDGALVLRKKPEGWAIASRYDAPVRKQQIDGFLDALSNLRGELRGEAPETFDEFGVGEEGALHARLRDSDGKEPAHLLLGKPGDRWDRQFVRLDGRDEVYQTDNLGQKAGVYGDGGKPEHGAWLERECFRVDGGALDRIEIATPDRLTVLERKEEEAGSGRKWRLVQPHLSWSAQDTLDAYVAGLTAISCDDVIDPAPQDGYRFDSEGLSIAYRGEGIDRRIAFGGLVEKSGRPMQADGRGMVFRIPIWTVKQLFRALDQIALPDRLFPGAVYDAASPATLTLSHQGRTLRLEGDGSGWRCLEPDLPAQAEEIKRLAQALVDLKPGDLADAFRVGETGLGEGRLPWAEVVLAQKEKILRLTIGAESPVRENARYARQEGGVAPPEGFVYILGDADGPRFAPGLKKLVELPTPGWKADAILRLELTRGTERIAFTRNSPTDPWQSDREGRKVQDGAMKKLLAAVEALHWLDWLGRDLAAEGLGLEPPVGLLRIGLAGGEEKLLRIGSPLPDRPDERAARIDGGPDCWSVSAGALDDLVPAPDALLEPPAAESAPEPKTPGG